MTSKHAVLISIHPEHVNNILSGNKKIEFRRKWAKSPVSSIVIYSTSPVCRIVAVAEIENVVTATPFKLWELCRSQSGGISQKELYSYLSGVAEGRAISLKNVREFNNIINPRDLFGDDFRPPQSFRYLSKSEFSKINRYRKNVRW